MLALLTTLMILIAVAFAAVVIAMTLVGNRDLILAALYYQEPTARAARPMPGAGKRPITVLSRSRCRSLCVAA